MKKKVLLGYKFQREGFLSLEKDFDLIYPDNEYLSKEEAIVLLADADAFVPSFRFKTDKEVIQSGRKLRIIANYGVGYDNVDVAYASSRGIVVANTPQSVLEPTAELCFGLMLAVARRIAFYDHRIRTLEKPVLGLFEHLGVALYGKTLGIFGMGRIGQAVARRALASGMNIIYHNRKPLPEDIEEKYQARYVGFNAFLAESDFLSLNAPATNETFHLIGEKELEKMKPSAILINTARGSLVDESALIKALENKKIRGAGLDVYEYEPQISEGLKRLDNVVLTPHVGTQTFEGRIDIQKEVASNIIGFFQGKPISRVN